MPVGLAEHRDSNAGRLQHAGQNAGGESGMVDVGIPGDENDVHAVPAASLHLGAARRQVGRAASSTGRAGNMVGAALEFEAGVAQETVIDGAP